MLLVCYPLLVPVHLPPSLSPEVVATPPILHGVVGTRRVSRWGVAGAVTATAVLVYVRGTVFSSCRRSDLVARAPVFFWYVVVRPVSVIRPHTDARFACALAPRDRSRIIILRRKIREYSLFHSLYHTYTSRLGKSNLFFCQKLTYDTPLRVNI